MPGVKTEEKPWPDRLDAARLGTAEPARHGTWAIALVLATAGYGLALHHGYLSLPSALWIALLLAAGVAARSRRAPLRLAGHALFITLGAALAFHALPGFGNALLIDRVIVSEGAPPYSMYLNLDKPLIGLWLLLVCPWIAPAYSRLATLRAATTSAATTIALCLSIAMTLGAVAWDPKWPGFAGIWMANNLLLVCMAEEALFRGYVMGGLIRLGGRFARAALPASSLLFGLAHFSGGWEWMALAALAGAGYGWAYRQGGLLAAVAVHFLLNLTHFGLFSYPTL